MNTDFLFATKAERLEAHKEEKKNGLNANDAADASQNKLHQHYTNIEVYINSLIK